MKGIGRALMSELELRFRQLQVVKVSFWIEAKNRKVIDFYLDLGYEERDLITLSKTFR
jgi:ribosomal protein S18 acetylase RimI-like enzyme